MTLADLIRLRLGEGRFVEEHLSAPGPSAPANTRSDPAPAPKVQEVFRPGAARLVIALIEAVPAGGADLAMSVVEVLEQAGHRVGILSLDKENRLGARLGAAAPAPSWCWKQASPDLLVRSGLRVLAPGPAAEGEIGSEAVDRVLHLVRETADIVLADLGCRWEPRLFRPVLLHAEQIWVLVRAGQWTGAEMRLEQAECSGWLEMRRVRLVVVGDGAPPPAGLGVPVAGVLPAPGGEAARSFALRELGRVSR